MITLDDLKPLFVLVLKNDPISMERVIHAYTNKDKESIIVYAEAAINKLREQIRDLYIEDIPIVEEIID